ncbi:MAG: ion channel, partial [Pseudomonadota bacterium]
MPFIENALRRAYIAIANLTWGTLGLAALIHIGVSYILLGLAAEEHLTGRPVDFLYYYVTTATTVGYGDLSPASAFGRWVALFFVLPGSITLFTAVLGKAITDLGEFWRRRMNGYGDYTGRSGHTVVLGWQGGKTRRLIDLLLADHPSGERIVLVSRDLEQNPMPDVVDLVRADSLSTRADLVRSGIATAGGALVRGRDDDETLAATLAAAAVAPDVHIVAYFEDERSAELIGSQCPS